MSQTLAVLGTVIFTILAPGTVTVVVPYLLLTSRLQIFAVEIGTLRFFGSVPIIAGVLIYSWCAWDFAFSGRVYQPLSLLLNNWSQGAYTAMSETPCMSGSCLCCSEKLCSLSQLSFFFMPSSSFLCFARSLWTMKNRP